MVLASALSVMWASADDVTRRDVDDDGGDETVCSKRGIRVVPISGSVGIAGGGEEEGGFGHGSRLGARLSAESKAVVGAEENLGRVSRGRVPATAVSPPPPQRGSGRAVHTEPRRHAQRRRHRRSPRRKYRVDPGVEEAISGRTPVPPVTIAETPASANTATGAKATAVVVVGWGEARFRGSAVTSISTRVKEHHQWRNTQGDPKR